MRYVVFPSASHTNGGRPQLSPCFERANIKVVHGPTESGLYLIEGNADGMELLRVLVEPFYILFEDFEIPTIH